MSKISIKTLPLLKQKSTLSSLPEGKLLINTINAHSYNVSQKDDEFTIALLKGDVLIPDGTGIVKAAKFLRGEKIERIAGWDLFQFEMDKLNKKGGKCFFLGSSERTLLLIKEKAKEVYPNILIETYSPPYKTEFSEEENKAMVNAVNTINPDLLWIGMTAPKQEKWAYKHLNDLNINCHIGTIGAVFDFFAGTIKRAPMWWQKNSLEWLYRLIKEPKRMWKRYILGNTEFIIYVLRERLHT
ncbi:MAG: WecB/TagA/CpsF family glycosyltransferase [Prevotellaceae bacterium]|jgi:N-acetylglucosaminyldiphosphoundecaprenol N-acetyl-beta-D-mannosaminyltransferase|nr:WecB/TagA/CpsF family glycosyltransferase [Prevotellaceae bacterium]